MSLGGEKIIDEDLKPNITKCKEHKRKKIKTKNVQQIEKQNETKIESQSVPIGTPQKIKPQHEHQSLTLKKENIQKRKNNTNEPNTQDNKKHDI